MLVGTLSCKRCKSAFGYTVEPGHYWDQHKLSIIERVSSGQGFIIHYIWDSVSVHYRGMRCVL